MSTETIWIGHCYDILYVDQFSLGDPEAYPLPTGNKRTGTKEGSAFDFNTSNIDKWSSTTPLGSTISQSHENVISSTQSYQTKLSNAVEGGASFLSFSGSLSAQVDSLVKNDLSQKELTTLTTSTRETKKITLLDEDSSNPPPLDSDFKDMLWAATSTQEDFAAFVGKYGTHFSNTVTMGGSGRQSFQLNTRSVAELSELGIDISAEASGTIKAVELYGQTKAKTHINKSFFSEISSQSLKINYLGGKGDLDFNDWLKSVDSYPVPIKVNLLDHSFFISSNYFPSKSGISTAKQTFQGFLSSYIQSNGRNLGASQLADGDLVCICHVSGQAGGDLPLMLMQGSNPVSTQSVMKSPGSNVSPQEFMASYAQDYKAFVWKVEHSKSSEQGQSFKVNDLITLTNLATGFKLNGEGANPNQGWVSAENGDNILGTAPKSSVDWRIKNKIDYFNSTVEQPINSGDIISLHSVYDSPSPADPMGYLSIRNKQAFSTGQSIGAGSLIEQDMAFQLFKLNV